jgi:acetyltransferase-like isoleucine patch superfamily enzyme
MGKAIKSWVNYIYFGFVGKFELLFSNISRATDFAYLRYYGVETKFGYVKLLGFPIIYRSPGSRIIIGEGVTLVSNAKHNIAGINHPVILATLTDSAIISIGSGSGCSGSVLCAVKEVSVGKHVALGANCKLYDSDFHPVQPGKRLNQKSIVDAKSAPIKIADHVWISEGALVLKGVEMGFGSVLSAKSVLTTNAKPLSIYVGNPAVFVREILDDTK